MLNAEELVSNLERNGEEYARFIEAQPEEAFHHRPGRDEWTAAELTGHVAEFPVTFSEQASRLAASPGLALGRTLDDPGRLAAVAKLAGAGPSEAAAAVRRGLQQAATNLRGIPSEGWQVKGRHARLGEMTAAEVVEHFIVEHVRDHLEQARAAVQSATRQT